MYFLFLSVTDRRRFNGCFLPLLISVLHHNSSFPLNYCIKPCRADCRKDRNTFSCKTSLPRHRFRSRCTMCLAAPSIPCGYNFSASKAVWASHPPFGKESGTRTCHWKSSRYCRHSSKVRCGCSFCSWFFPPFCNRGLIPRLNTNFCAWEPTPLPGIKGVEI